MSGSRNRFRGLGATLGWGAAITSLGAAALAAALWALEGSQACGAGAADGRGAWAGPAARCAAERGAVAAGWLVALLLAVWRAWAWRRAARDRSSMRDPSGRQGLAPRAAGMAGVAAGWGPAPFDLQGGFVQDGQDGAEERQDGSDKPEGKDAAASAVVAGVSALQPRWPVASPLRSQPAPALRQDLAELSANCADLSRLHGSVQRSAQAMSHLVASCRTLVEAANEALGASSRQWSEMASLLLEMRTHSMALARTLDPETDSAPRARPLPAAVTLGPARGLTRASLPAGMPAAMPAKASSTTPPAIGSAAAAAERRAQALELSEFALRCAFVFADCERQALEAGLDVHSLAHFSEALGERSAELLRMVQACEATAAEAAHQAERLTQRLG